MNFEPYRIYYSGGQPTEDYTFYEKFYLGFDRVGNRVFAEIHIKFPKETKVVVAKQQLLSISWLYYKIIAFQHIIHMLKSKELKENTKLLQSSGFLDLDHPIQRAQRGHAKFVHFYEKYTQQEKLEPEIYYSTYYNKLDNLDDLHLIKNYYIKKDNNRYYETAVIEYFEDGLFFRAKHADHNLKENFPKEMYGTLFKETSTGVFFIYFISEYLLDTSYAGKLVKDDIIKEAVDVLVDYKDLLNSVKEDLLARIPIKEPGKYTFEKRSTVEWRNRPYFNSDYE